MPFYEYHCDACNADFEKRLPLSEADVLPPCPHCHSERTRKRLSKICTLGTSTGASSDSSSSNTPCCSCGGSV